MKNKSVVSIVLFLCLGLFFSLPAGASAATKVKGLTMSSIKVSGTTYDSVTISWSKVKHAAGYYVFRSNSKNGKYVCVGRIKDGKTTSFKDTDVEQGKTYYYKARVKYAKGKFGGKVKAVIPEQPFTDKKPTVSAEIYKSGTHISWNKIDSATSYRVYRATSKSGKYSKIGTTKSTKLYYNDYSGESAKTYYYKVRGVKTSGKKNSYTSYSSAKKFKTVTRVFIAAGHGTDVYGSWDSGCTYKSYTEAGLMLPITKAMVKYMRNSGVFVYTDADNGNNKNMLACVSWANKKKISVYMSIHCDWRYAPTGTMPLYRSSKDKKLAQALNKGVTKNFNIGTRGLSYRLDLYELNAPKAAASCIFETGSIGKDYKKLKKSDSYGKSLAKGLCSYLDVKFVEK